MRRILLLMWSAWLCASCGGTTSTSPTTTDTDTRQLETFTGVIGPSESMFYSFTVGTSGTTDVTFLSLHPSGSPTPALSAVMGIGIGTPAGPGCRLSTATTGRSALIPQLSTQTTPSIYCVNLQDVGNLLATAGFTIQIHHP